MKNGVLKSILWGFFFLLVLLPVPLLAQMGDQSTISTQGTQFIAPDKPPPPPKPKAQPPPPKPPELPRIEQPEQAAVRPPPQPGPPPRFPSVVILLDASDSMLNRVDGRDATRLEEAKQAIQQVVKGMSKETRVQLWIFNTRMIPLSIDGGSAKRFIAVGETGLREKLIDRIGSIRTGGGTNLYKSIISALEIFGAPEDQEAYRSGQRFPVLVIISDGEDGMKTGHSLNAVLAARKRFPLVTINTIGFHIKGHDRLFRQLCQIATRSDGCGTADDRNQLKTILESFYRFRR